METNDNTLQEMQQQMQQLRDMLADQKIVNERILRNSCRTTVNRLRIKSSVPIIAGFAGLGLLPVLRSLGFSYTFLIVTGVFLLVAMAATMITKRFIPSVNRDLVTAATEITKFRKINADWYKFGIPCLIVWLGLLVWDIVKNMNLGGEELYGFICGGAVGLLIGLGLGLKNRRDLLNASDELLAQIEELKN